MPIRFNNKVRSVWIKAFDRLNVKEDSASAILPSSQDVMPDVVLASSLPKTRGEMEMLSSKHKKERRSGLDRRQFSYDLYIPERRSGSERRDPEDRSSTVEDRDETIESVVVAEAVREALA